jgi:hypothetical protein
VEDILITFSSPVTAFALNYGTFGGSDLSFTLSNGGTFTEGSTGGSDNYSTPDFAGVTAASAFQSVLITTPPDGIQINNISTGFAVPEPSTGSLFILSLTAFVVAARRFRRVLA